MNKNVLIIFIFLFTSVMLFASGNREKKAPQDALSDAPAVVQITGVVRLTGSALFAELIISGSENIWYIVNEEAGKLHELQHRTVTVEAEETVAEIFFANGRSAGIRRELRNIRILSVER